MLNNLNLAALKGIWDFNFMHPSKRLSVHNYYIKNKHAEKLIIVEITKIESLKKYVFIFIFRFIDIYVV